MARGLPTVPILGVRVAIGSMTQMVDAVVGCAQHMERDREAEYVCATSVHGLIVGSEDEDFRRILNRAFLVTPDGMPLVWVGRMLGARDMARGYGPTLMKEVCRKTAASDMAVRHYFYGGAPGVPETLAATLRAEFPGMDVAGCYSPPFRELREDELQDVAVRIRDSNARIVWVGLSTPKQERFIQAIRPFLNGVVLLSVGAAFDFHTGRIRQAPAYIQRAGLEWLFRLRNEPGRLWRRYLYNNPRFVWRSIQQILHIRVLNVLE